MINSKLLVRHIIDSPVYHRFFAVFFGLTELMVVRMIFFFFQAEDGIRGGHGTGVQTCALPISAAPAPAGARCSPTGRSSPAARRPRWPSSAAPRRGSAPRAAAAGDAAAPRRTR